MLQDFQAQVARVATPAYDEALLAQLPTTPYEFPNGYNDMFGLERFRIPELLFSPNFQTGDDMDTSAEPSTCVFFKNRNRKERKKEREREREREGVNTKNESERKNERAASVVEQKREEK